MDRTDIGEHIVHRFDEELEALRSEVLRAGGLVESQLSRALAALSSPDAAAAEAVISADSEVNALEVAVDERCAQLMVKRQPLARDLRFVLSAIKAITDIERIGDEAVRIARMALRLSEREGDRRTHGEIRHLGQHVQGMLHSALDAYARMDVERAAAVMAEDRSVDREYESVTRELVTHMMEDPRAIARSIDVLFSARALERIGDRSCNLCEYVIYFVSARDVRHAPVDEVVDGPARSSR